MMARARELIKAGEMFFLQRRMGGPNDGPLIAMRLKSAEKRIKEQGANRSGQA
jgi:hypothetical protein